MSSLRRPRPLDAGLARRTVGGAAGATRAAPPGLTAATTGGSGAAAACDGDVTGRARSGRADEAERLSAAESPISGSTAPPLPSAAPLSGAGPVGSVVAGAGPVVSGPLLWLLA